jgi:hypothetical protein
MSFKPAGTTDSPMTNSNAPSVDYNAINAQVKGGSRPARISLIIDLGVQQRDPFTEAYVESSPKHIKALAEQGAIILDNGEISIPQKDQPQIAVFADLTSDVVDYGGDLGRQPYRLSLNGSDFGAMRGMGFSGSYAFDKNGQIQKDKGFTFHTMSPLTKLAKATKQTQIISGSGVDNMDVAQLLDKPFMAQVDKTEKTKDDGTEAIYLNFKGCSEVPMVPSDASDPDSEEVMMMIKPLLAPPTVITFDNVTEDVRKWIRGDVAKKIKLAVNYSGSKMQAVLEGVAPNTEGLPKPDLNKSKPVVKKVEPEQEEDEFSEIPF